MSYSIIFFVIALIVLAILCICASSNIKPITQENYVKYLRWPVIVFTATFALAAVFRITQQVALPRTIPCDFVPELVGYLMFWVLVPPVWFFFEYLAFDSGWITLHRETDRSARLIQIKNYSDFASKIWAGVVAILIIMVSLKK